MSRWSSGVLLRAILALMVARFIMAEGTGWNRVERYRERIPTLEVEDHASVPSAVNDLRNAGIGFGGSRIYGPLAARMMELAAPTIEDYRNDQPTARLPQWRTASAALKIAADAVPDSRRIRSRLRYVDGHLLRIEAQGKSADTAEPILHRAVEAFRDAARLDDEWPDPYIGLATVHAYGLHDVDAVVQDVGEAERRGFSGGRREQAEVADAYAYRADRTRADAANADGDERRQLLEAALADYQACIDHFSGVSGFFNADRNLERCRRYHEETVGDLEQEPAFELSVEPF
jgi:hypothetical protein